MKKLLGLGFILVLLRLSQWEWLVFQSSCEHPQLFLFSYLHSFMKISWKKITRQECYLRLDRIYDRKYVTMSCRFQMVWSSQQEYARYLSS